MIEQMKNGKLSRSGIWIYYSILFFLIGVIVFLPFLIFKRTLIWNSDGYLQWYAILSKVKNIVFDFFEGRGFSFWGWDTGLGSDLIGDYAMVLCDPFSYLAVFFEDKYLDVAYSVIVILKMYLAGMVILGFTRYHKKKDWVCILCALGYVFCAWSVVCLRHDFFMSQLILFPLLIWGVDRVDDRKSPVLLIFSVMASVVSSLYFSYMSALFVVIYVVMKYFLQEGNKSLRDFFSRMLRFILYAIIGGVFLAGPILFPVFSSLLQASTGSGIDYQFLPDLKQVLRFIPALAGTGDVNGNYSILGTNMLFVSLIPAIILLRKKRKTSFYMFLLCALFVLLPFVQSILNGMSYASGRWCYVFCFFFVFAVSDCLDTFPGCTEQYKKGIKIWFGIIFVASLLAGIVFKAISVYELFVVFLNLAFGSYIVTSMIKGPDKMIQNNIWGNKRLIAAMIVNITILPLIAIYPGYGNGVATYMSQGACYDIYKSTALKTASEIKDEDFYRVDTVDHPGNNGIMVREAHTPANTNIFWQIPSIYEYLSTINANWIHFNQLLGNSSGSFRRVCIYSNDNRSRMDFLLGVRYFLSDDRWNPQSQYAGYGFKNIKQEEDVNILKSPYKAGLGYVFNRFISESDFMKYSEVEREQLLMQCVELKDEDVGQVSVPEADPSELTVQKDIVPAILSDEDGIVIQGNTFKISEKGKKIKVKPEKKVFDSEVYIVFKNFKKKRSSPEELWRIQNEEPNDGPDTIPLAGEDALQYYNYLSNYLSYSPYGDFSIILTNPNNGIRKRIFSAEGEAQGIRDNENYMVNMGYYNKFDGEIICEFGTLGEYSFDDVYIIPVPVNSYKEQAAKLSKNRFKVKSNRGDYIKGSVSSETDGILYLSILYNQGWKVYVDGNQVDKVFRINTAFTGVELSVGDHVIELVYRPMGYPYSFALFAIGLFMTIIIALYFKRNNMRERVKKQEEKSV